MTLPRSAEPVKFTAEVIVVGTDKGAEVRHFGWHGPVEVPVGHAMKVRVETTVMPLRIEEVVPHA